MSERTRILWLTPAKPENISVGSQRAAKNLEDRGFIVVRRSVAFPSILTSLRDTHQFDIVIGTTHLGAILGSMLSVLFRKPLLVQHIDPISQLYSTSPTLVAYIVEHLENIAFQIADHVFYFYDEEESRVKTRSRSASRMDLGIEFDLFANPPAWTIADANQRLDLDETTNVAIYIGGLEPIYHIKEMLKAFEEVDDWTLLVLGTGSLEFLVESSAGKHENIRFLETVSHEKVPGYVHCADVGLCLVDDPHTLKTVEYLATGIPVVQLDGRARRRFGDHVYYCDSHPDDIERAVRDAAATGAAEAGREFASQFGWSPLLDIYEDVIRELTNEDANK